MTKYFQAENLMIELTDDQLPIIDFVKKRDDLILQLKDESTNAIAQIDSLTEQVKNLSTALEEALQKNVELKEQAQADDFAIRYEARRKLETVANLDDVSGLTDRQIKEKVILRATNFDSVEDKDDVVIDAMFDFIINIKDDSPISKKKETKELQIDSLSSIQRKDQENQVISYAEYRNAQRAIGV
jgi:hypothetical protein